MNSQEPFKREYSFLYIVTPEDKAKYGPKRETDEYWANLNQSWYRVGFGSDFSTINHYRRKISPGPDHEIVPLDGVIEAGDEWTMDGVAWHSVSTAIKCIGQSVQGQIDRGSHLIAIRRPIKPVESGWVSVKERLPEQCHRVLVCEAGEFPQIAYFKFALGSTNLHWCDGNTGKWVERTITHWMPIPPAPQPPRPAAEVAFDKWLHGASIPTCGLKSARDGWEAAIDWAKSHKGEL